MKVGDLVYWMRDIPCIVLGRAKHTDLTSFVQVILSTIALVWTCFAVHLYKTRNK